MLICNCTLPYTNPEACKTCSAYLKEYPFVDWVSNGWNLQKWVETWNGTGYDSNRYELVEKKNWKIKQLEEEIAHYEMKLKEEDTLRLQSHEREGKLRLEHVKALEELKELKKEQ